MAYLLILVGIAVGLAIAMSIFFTKEPGDTAVKPEPEDEEKFTPPYEE